AKVDDLVGKLNTVMDTNATLSKQVNESKKAKITEAACAGLTATQAAKVKTLAEGVEYSGSDADFEKKIKVIRESYLNPNSTSKQGAVEKHVTLNEKIHEEGDAEVPEDGKAYPEPQMNHYLAALKRTQQI
ncbi:MAG: hypothetical protein ACRDFB_00595, partial [Rhabdochlamydiaceae bacterium]